MNPQRESPPTSGPVSLDLILWRIEQLEAKQEELHVMGSRLEKTFSNYRAVVKFAMGVSAAVGGAVAFLVSLLRGQ